MSLKTARAWAARYHDVDLIDVVLFFGGKERMNLTLGKAIATQFARDLTQTDTDGDEHHDFLFDGGRVRLMRDQALGLRNALAQLLEASIFRAPVAGYSSDNIKLSLGSTVQMNTMWKTRWV